MPPPASSLAYQHHTPSDDVTCLICLGPVGSDAVELSCHPNLLYCAECIGHWLTQLVIAGRPPTCPTCRRIVNIDNLTYSPSRLTLARDGRSVFDDVEDFDDYAGWGQGYMEDDDDDDIDSIEDVYYLPYDLLGEVEGEDDTSSEVARSTEARSTEAQVCIIFDSSLIETNLSRLLRPQQTPRPSARHHRQPPAMTQM